MSLESSRYQASAAACNDMTLFHTVRHSEQAHWLIGLTAFLDLLGVSVAWSACYASTLSLDLVVAKCHAVAWRIDDTGVA